VGRTKKKPEPYTLWNGKRVVKKKTCASRKTQKKRGQEKKSVLGKREGSLKTSKLKEGGGLVDERHEPYEYARNMSYASDATREKHHRRGKKMAGDFENDREW